MLLEGILVCDLCRCAIFPEDVAPVRIQVEGTLHQFHYHNRHREDCLAQQIELLRQHFAEQQETAQDTF